MKHKGVLILGAGSAGLLLAKHLAQEFIAANCSPGEIAVIGRASGGSSVLSSWYIAQYEPEAFEQRLVSGLGPHPQPEQMRLVQYVARNHIQATDDFASEVMQHVDIGGIKRFHDGFSGIKTLTGYSSVNALPGRRILDFLKREVMSVGVQVSVATITDLARTADGFEVAGVVRGNERVVRQAAKLVIATGGMAHLYEFSTSGRGKFPNVLQRAYEHLGLAVEDLDRAVFFPFAVNHEGFRAGSILPPSFMTRARILLQTLDGRLREFVSDELKAAVKTGDYRPQFPELIRLFDRLIQGGNRIMVSTLMSEDEFEAYKGEDHYGYVFKGKAYEDAQLISVAPAYHSALGGLVVDEQCRSSDPNVFAIGESALVFGFDRPIGGEHVSAITMAPLVASVIARELIKEGRTTVGEKVVRAATTLLDARMAIDQQDHKIVELVLNAKLTKTDALVRDLGNGDPYIRLLFSRVGTKVNNLKLRQLLSYLDDTALERVRETPFPETTEEVLLSREEIWHALGLMREPYYSDLLEALALRLAVVAQIAPFKLRRQKLVRDAAREEEVMQKVADQAAAQADKRFLASFYRHLVLPSSFELQTLYMRQKSSYRAPGRVT